MVRHVKSTNAGSMREMRGRGAFQIWKKNLRNHSSSLVVIAIIAVTAFSIALNGWRPALFEGVASASSSMLVEQPSTRYAHTSSVEWYPRPTIDISMVGEADKGVTVYDTNFPGSSIGYPGFWKLVGTGGWEKDTFEVLRFFLEGRPTDSYVDFGAWIGPTALYAAHYSRHVYAIEPDPMAYSALVANAEKNIHLARSIRTYFESLIPRKDP